MWLTPSPVIWAVRLRYSYSRLAESLLKTGTPAVNRKWQLTTWWIMQGLYLLVWSSKLIIETYCELFLWMASQRRWHLDLRVERQMIQVRRVADAYSRQNKNTDKKVHVLFKSYTGVENIVQGVRKWEKRLERWARSSHGGPHIFFPFLTSLLENNCFTKLCYFLYNKVNQLYIYIYPHISSLLRLPPILLIPPI